MTEPFSPPIEPDEHAPQMTLRPVSMTPLTALIGRERECAAIIALLLQEDIHLLTLTGIGGVGKTRLALAVLDTLQASFVDGVHFVSLSALSDPELVLPTIAQTLEQERGQQPTLDRLYTALHNKQMLLVLDNFEQVITAGPQLVALLAGCPALTLLVTSRERLHVAGEHCWTLLPLPVPDLSQKIDLMAIAQQPAVALFVARAQALQWNFLLTRENWQSIAQICITLDGLPLALELAAAHSKLLPPRTLLARLSQRMRLLTRGRRDAPLRQQTLRNTLTWSYDLLSAQEQALFRCLCVFVGGCTLVAVETLSQELGATEANLLDLLSSLLDKHLIQQPGKPEEEPRLHILETIREFGLERLNECQELSLMRHKHAQYYLHWAQAANRSLFGQKQAQVIQQWVQEQGNLRTAMSFVIEQKDLEAALNLAGALGRFWLLWGYLAHFLYLHEGEQFLTWVLANTQGQESRERANALAFYGSIIAYLGQPEQGEVTCRHAVEILQRLGAIQELINALWMVIQALTRRCDFRAAREYAEEAVALVRTHPEACTEWGNAWTLGYSLYLEGTCTQAQGDYTQAWEQFTESLVLFTQAGNPFYTLLSHLHLGRIASWQGDAASAHSHLEQVALGGEQYGLHSLIAEARFSQGYLAWQAGDAQQARHLFTQSQCLQQKVEHQPGIAWAQLQLARVEITEQQLDVARPLLEESLAQGIQAQQRDGVAACLEGLGILAGMQSQFVQAVHYLAVAAALRDVMGVQIPPAEQREHDQWMQHLHSALGATHFQATWDQGYGMTPEQALKTCQQTPETTPLPSQSPHARKLPTATTPIRLTRRERDVLHLLTEGLTNAQIAEKLVLSTVTVNSYLRSIYRKLGVSSRTQAVRCALESHLI